MGNICKWPLTKDEQTSRAIDNRLKVDRRREDMKMKLLLLGAAESGKSTLFKQMRLLYSEQHGFLPAEREDYKGLIMSSILDDMQSLSSSTLSRREVKSMRAQKAAREIHGWSSLTDERTGDLLTTVWEDPGTQQRWADRDDLQVQDSLEFYMNNFSRITAKD